MDNLDRKSNLIEYLPSFYHNSDFVKAFMHSESIEVDLLNYYIDDLVKNLYVSTATWGLDYFEEELGLVTDKSKPYAERRERILAKKRGNGTTTIKMLKDTALAFDCGEIDVIEKFNEYKFILRFTSQKGVPKNLADFKSMVDEIKPAHLAYEFEYSYNTWGMIKHKTWSELKILTWEQVKTH